jgi:hypothetical protein
VQEGQASSRVQDDIVNPASLTRQGKLELCAQCHSGLGTLKGTPYTYRPGDELRRYFMIDPKEGEDVHASHAIRFQQSPCFQQSANLHCWDCHSPHEDKRNDLAYYSKICLHCHEETMPRHLSGPDDPASLRNNCIDCHMPVQDSQLLNIHMINGPSLHPRPRIRIRNHRIGIYPALVP